MSTRNKAPRPGSRPVVSMADSPSPRAIRAAAFRDTEPAPVHVELKRGEVPTLLEDLGRALVCAETALSDLAGRIEPAMTPGSDTAAGPDADHPAAPCDTPLGVAVWLAKERVLAIARHANSLCDRVEL